MLERAGLSCRQTALLERPTGQDSLAGAAVTTAATVMLTYTRLHLRSYNCVHWAPTDLRAAT